MVNRDKWPRLLLKSIPFVQAIGVFHHLFPTAVSLHCTCTAGISLQIPGGSTSRKDTGPKCPYAPATADLCNPGTVIYCSSTLPVIAVPASVLDRKLVLPCYQFLRCDAPALLVVTMNRAIWPLETMFVSELVTSSTASQKCSRTTTVCCTGHQQAEQVCSQLSWTQSWVATSYGVSEVSYS